MTKPLSRLLSALTVLTIATTLISSNAVAQSGSRSTVRSGTTTRGTVSNGSTKKGTMSKENGMAAKATPIGLEGYCPVCIVAKKKWEKGDSRIASTYDGVTYHFPSKAIQKTFDANPVKFVPALNGDCIVCYEKMEKRVAGSIRHAALHKGRLYLFPSAKEKAMFSKNTRMFEDTDLASKGECIVCLAKMGKHVPGIAKHTVIHKGFRYQFPSAAEAGMFQKTPDKFVSMGQEMEKKSMMKTSS